MTAPAPVGVPLPTVPSSAGSTGSPSGPAAGPSLGRAELDTLLAARAAALRTGDRAALLGGSAPGAAEAQAALLGRTAGVPFAELAYRVGPSFTEPGPQAVSASVAVELAFRLAGVDDYPAVLQRKVDLVRDGGRWLVAGEEPVGSAALWDLGGTVRTASGKRCLVLGVADADALGEVAGLADRAVPAVGEVWGAGWGGHLLLELAETEEQFARLLDVPADTYRGIAAVTLAMAGAPVRTPADRVLVNPEAYRDLSELGRRVVVTHEATHVATRADTRAWTPLWLSEGVADWTAYRESGRTARQIAPELAAEVRAGRVPTALPDDAAFAAGAAGIAQAYEMSWLACDLVARQYGGATRLVALYRAVAAAGAGQLEKAFRTELGIGVAEFTRQWAKDLTARLG
ncbi:hypothetical protein ACGFX4_16750 [Kitasatospora sp. NPDC048365]|uniref:hypothetical protein n=1 Tax=Kitasatospora sp. NPDC048365 TaxID=3364050 RepID=UPI0037137004